jgi:photosynthetic reaction center cytochrome c subunit
MRLGSRRTIVSALGTAVVCLLGIALARGQAGPEEKAPLAEQVFKNVQLLRGIPVNQFMETMGFFSGSLGVNCTYCHDSESNWAKYADDNESKQTARKMIVMMRAINQSYFGGRRVLTCYSCHRGGETPRVTPSLAEVYGTPPAEEPDEILEQAPGAPSADQLLDKYVQALGGAQRLAGLTSFVAKGTYQGYAETQKSAFEVFAKAPDQRTTIMHTPNGDSTTTYNGRTAWTAVSGAPVPVLALTGGDLDGAKVDADLSFPARIKQALSRWRAGFPATIDDRDVQVVQGTTAGGINVKLYFDKESGLLMRQMRFTDSPVGLIPTQIDYADYREVSGVKIPFRWTVSWLDGRSTFELSEVQPNAPIDAAKFAKPAPPPPVPETP